MASWLWALTLLLACAPQASDSFAAPALSAQPSSLLRAQGLAPRSPPPLIPAQGGRGTACRARMTSTSQPTTSESEASLDDTAIGFPFGKSFRFEGNEFRGARDSFLIEFGEYDPTADKPVHRFRWKMFSSKTFVSLDGRPAKEPCMVWVAPQDDGSLMINLKIDDEIAGNLRCAGAFCFKDRHTGLQIIYASYMDGALTIRSKLPKDPPMPTVAV